MVSSVYAAGVFLMVGAAWAASAVVAAGNGGEEEVIKDRAGFFPKLRFPALPGKAVGVLASDTQAVLKLEGRSGPPDARCFSSAGGSYRWVYVPVEKDPLIEALDVPVGKEGKVKRFESLGFADPQTVKRWGIREPYTLVEVEVNGGLGSPEGADSFVVTKLKVLDGTDGYPLQVAKAVADLRRRYADYLKEQDKAIEAGQREAQKVLKEKKPTGPREKSELLFVTWFPESERLRVHFFTRLTDGVYSYGRGIEPKRNGGPAPPTAQGIRFGTMFGVELGMAYELDKAGKVVRVQKLPIRTFQEELMPPPGGGVPPARPAVPPGK